MVEYVLVSQGMEIDRSKYPYGIVSEAIKSNIDWSEYRQKCIDNYERPADNECFVYKENGKDVDEIDLIFCEQLIKHSYNEAFNRMEKEIQYLLHSGMGKKKSLEHLLRCCQPRER